MTKRAGFVYLKGCKLRTKIVENGLEKWCEVSHFFDHVAPQATVTVLLIFRVSILINANIRRVHVQVRQRNADYITILDTLGNNVASYNGEYRALLQAESAIANYISERSK